MSEEARLPVLSCCQSAQGDIRAEGVVGIAGTFLGATARARTVLVALWVIDDDATPSYMELFYNRLYQNMQVDDQLRKVSKCALFYIIGDDIQFSNDEKNKIRERVFAF